MMELKVFSHHYGLVFSMWYLNLLGVRQSFSGGRGGVIKRVSK